MCVCICVCVCVYVCTYVQMYMQAYAYSHMTFCVMLVAFPPGKAGETVSAKHSPPSWRAHRPGDDVPPSSFSTSTAPTALVPPPDGADEAPAVPAELPVGDGAPMVPAELPDVEGAELAFDAREPVLAPNGPDPELNLAGREPDLAPEALHPLSGPQGPESGGPESEPESDPASPDEALDDTLAEQQHEAAMQSVHDRLIFQSRRTAETLGSVLFLDEVFHCCNLEVAHGMQPRRSEFRALNKLIASGFRFYVGASQGPVRRWQGDPEPRNGRGPMEGHHKTWRQMHVIAARLGPAGAAVETDLIRYGMDNHPDRCTNKAADSRGLSKSQWALNFVYVCTFRLSD